MGNSNIKFVQVKNLKYRFLGWKYDFYLLEPEFKQKVSQPI